jgi:hypothetical protein
MNDKLRRNKRYIDPPVQNSLARRIIMHWAIYFVAATTVTLLLHFYSNPLLPIGTHFKELWWSLAPSLIVMLCLVPIFVFDSIKVSSRFTGPIARLRSAIDDLSQGKPHELASFREGDFWQTLAQDFNKMVSHLKNQDRTDSPGGAGS